MSWGIALAVVALALAVALAALRSHVELRAWLGADPRPRRRFARSALLAACAALAGWSLAVAATRPPRLAGAGADVVIALDVSRSMNAADSAPSRLRRATHLAERVVLSGAPVRLALIAFAGDAYVALPLTHDADSVLTYLRAIDGDVITALGTDLARALDTAGSVFDPRSSRARRVLLFTDGEHTGAGLEETLARLRTLGAKVVPVGFGTAEGSAVPGPGTEPLRHRDGRPVHSRRADAVLRQIAAETGGSYLRELEDHPVAARLLPGPEELRPDPDEERRADPALAALEAALFAAALLLALEMLLSLAHLRPPAGLRPRAAAVAAVALLAAGSTPWTWQREGDAALERGEPRQALSLYRKLERHDGITPRSRIRIGNALYGLGDTEKAAAAYLQALRLLRPEDANERFVAAFNLGAALLARERWGEARDALWTAMLERPDDLEAKFNYEWALERLEPDEQEVPLPPMPQSAPREGEQEARSADAQVPAEPERRERESVSEEEAERWLRTLEESVDEPLRRQAARGLDTASGERGPTW